MLAIINRKISMKKESVGKKKIGQKNMRAKKREIDLNVKVSNQRKKL